MKTFIIALIITGVGLSTLIYCERHERNIQQQRADSLQAVADSLMLETQLLHEPADYKKEHVDYIFGVTGCKVSRSQIASDLYFINQECYEYNLQPEMIYAIVETESSWIDPNLMQVMPICLADMGIQDNADSRKSSLYYGIKVVSELSYKYNGDMFKVLTAYNRGVHGQKNAKPDDRYYRDIMKAYEVYLSR
jgi:hypothetical protein